MKMKKYYAVGVRREKGQWVEGTLLEIFKDINLVEARVNGFNKFKEEWFSANGNRQIAVVGEAGYKRYWKELVENGVPVKS